MLRNVGGDHLPPWLTALVDAGLASPSVRPSAFDFFHEVLTRTSPPEVWIAPAVVSRHIVERSASTGSMAAARTEG